MLLSARSLQSSLSLNNREIRASFAYFGESTGGIFLQLRLRGGERRIRTVGTTPGLPFTSKSSWILKCFGL